MADIEDMVDQIVQGDNTDALKTFNDVMAQRINDAIDDEKIAVSQAIYNPSEDGDEYDDLDEYDEEEDDEEFEDEE